MLDIKEGKLGDRTHVDDPPRLIKYYLNDDKNVCPTLFNNVRKVGNPYPKDSTEKDPFALNVGIAKDKQIPEKLVTSCYGIGVDLSNIADSASPFSSVFCKLAQESFLRKQSGFSSYTSRSISTPTLTRRPRCLAQLRKSSGKS